MFSKHYEEGCIICQGHVPHFWSLQQEPSPFGVLNALWSGIPATVAGTMSPACGERVLSEF